MRASSPTFDRSALVFESLARNMLKVMAIASPSRLTRPIRAPAEASSAAMARPSPRAAPAMMMCLSTSSMQPLLLVLWFFGSLVLWFFGLLACWFAGWFAGWLVLGFQVSSPDSMRASGSGLRTSNPFRPALRACGRNGFEVDVRSQESGVGSRKHASKKPTGPPGPENQNVDIPVNSMNRYRQYRNQPSAAYTEYGTL